MSVRTVIVVQRLCCNNEGNHTCGTDDIFSPFADSFRRIEIMAGGIVAPSNVASRAHQVCTYIHQSTHALVSFVIS